MCENNGNNEFPAEYDSDEFGDIGNLVKARGLVDCPQALKLARTLVEENAEFARLSQNYVFENLSFRANVIAYLKACVLYVANGMKWEKTIEDFVRWSERYNLVPGMVLNSQKNLKRLIQRIVEARERGEAVWMEILKD